MMEQNNETFHYTYSAKQQDEVRAIREKYQPKGNAKLDQLRKLDASVDRAGTIAGLAVGLFGTALLGLSLFLIIHLGGAYFAPGVVIGVVGLVLMGFSAPVHHAVVRRKREQVAPEVLRLADELEQEGGEG